MVTLNLNTTLTFYDNYSHYVKIITTARPLDHVIIKKTYIRPSKTKVVKFFDILLATFCRVICDINYFFAHFTKFVDHFH